VNREVEINSFRVKSENGMDLIVIEYQEEIDVTHHGSDHREYIQGMKRLATSTGLSVNQIDPQTFKIVSTGETYRKV
jgi:hypothetical protein